MIPATRTKKARGHKTVSREQTDQPIAYQIDQPIAYLLTSEYCLAAECGVRDISAGPTADIEYLVSVPIPEVSATLKEYSLHRPENPEIQTLFETLQGLLPRSVESVSGLADIHIGGRHGITPVCIFKTRLPASIRERLMAVAPELMQTTVGGDIDTVEQRPFAQTTLKLLHEFAGKAEHCGRFIVDDLTLSPAEYYKVLAEAFTRAGNKETRDRILLRLVNGALCLYQLYVRSLVIQERPDEEWAEYHRAFVRSKFDVPPSFASRLHRPDRIAVLAVDTAAKSIEFNDDPLLRVLQEHVFRLGSGSRMRAHLAEYLHPYQTGAQPVADPEDIRAEALSANDAALFVKQSVLGRYSKRHVTKPQRANGQTVLQLSAIDELTLDENSPFSLWWRIQIVNWADVAACLDNRTARELEQTLSGLSVEELGKTNYNHFREQFNRIRSIVLGLHRVGSTIKAGRMRPDERWGVWGLG